MSWENREGYVKITDFSTRMMILQVEYYAEFYEGDRTASVNECQTLMSHCNFSARGN